MFIMVLIVGLSYAGDCTQGAFVPTCGPSFLSRLVINSEQFVPMLRKITQSMGRTAREIFPDETFPKKVSNPKVLLGENPLCNSVEKAFNPFQDLDSGCLHLPENFWEPSVKKDAQSLIKNLFEQVPLLLSDIEKGTDGVDSAFGRMEVLTQEPFVATLFEAMDSEGTSLVNSKLSLKEINLVDLRLGETQFQSQDNKIIVQFNLENLEGRTGLRLEDKKGPTKLRRKEDIDADFSFQIQNLTGECTFVIGSTGQFVLESCNFPNTDFQVSVNGSPTVESFKDFLLPEVKNFLPEISKKMVEVVNSSLASRDDGIEAQSLSMPAFNPRNRSYFDQRMKAANYAKKIIDEKLRKYERIPSISHKNTMLNEIQKVLSAYNIPGGDATRFPQEEKQLKNLLNSLRQVFQRIDPNWHPSINPLPKIAQNHQFNRLEEAFTQLVETRTRVNEYIKAQPQDFKVLSHPGKVVNKVGGLNSFATDFSLNGVCESSPVTDAEDFSADDFGVVLNLPSFNNILALAHERGYFQDYGRLFSASPKLEANQDKVYLVIGDKGSRLSTRIELSSAPCIGDNQNQCFRISPRTEKDHPGLSELVGKINDVFVDTVSSRTEQVKKMLRPSALKHKIVKTGIAKVFSSDVGQPKLPYNTQVKRFSTRDGKNLNIHMRLIQ